MSSQWEVITGTVSVPPLEKVYIICRSKSVAERWAARSSITKQQMTWLPDMLSLKGLKRDVLIFVIEMYDDSVFFREEVGREKIYWDNLTIVRL